MSDVEGIQFIQQTPVTVFDIGARFARIDELLVRELRHAMIEASANVDPPLVVIDLSHTKYFGSTFIEVLLRVNKNLACRDGGKVAFCGLSEYCREVFEVTKLDRLWGLFETREEAIESLIAGDT